MSNDSHLPVFHPDNDQDVLHGTQLLLMDSFGQRSKQLNNIKVAAYVSGKKALYIVNTKKIIYITFIVVIRNTGAPR